MPIAAVRSKCSGFATTNRAKICPFKQRKAAAVSTPSGAPPVPITACTDVPRTGFAYVRDQLLVAWAVQHYDHQILHVSVVAAGDRAQVVFHRGVQIDRA